MSERWTAETEELVARAVYGRRTGTNVDGFTDWDWDNAPLSPEARRAWRTRAAGVLTALADAGLLTPPGGETRQEWRVWVGAHAPFDRLDGDVVTPVTGREHVERRRADGYPDPGQVQTRTVYEGPWVAVNET